MKTHSRIVAPRQNGEKMIDLASKMEEIDDIEHNKGSKVYPQNQVILVCIMSSVPLKHKFFFTFLNWEKQTWYWEKDGYFRLGIRKRQNIPCN